MITTDNFSKNICFSNALIQVFGKVYVHLDKTIFNPINHNKKNSFMSLHRLYYRSIMKHHMYLSSHELH